MGGVSVPFFLVISPGIGRARSGCSRTSPAEGAPPGFRPIPHGGDICPFLFGNLSGNWTGAKRLFARKPGRGRTKKRGGADAPPKRTKRDPRVPQDEKVLTRFSQVGAPPYRVRLSVHKQTLPIGTDHLQSAPEFQMWIKIFRAPNTADRICYSVFKKEGLPSFYILLYTISARTQAFARVFFCQILPKGGK